MRIAYLLDSTELSGGVYVALLQAEALGRRGHRVAVVSPGPAPRWFPLSRARFERSSFADSRELASAEVRVATFWTTVAPALAAASGPVFHLSQGYEAAFSFYAAQRDRIEAAYSLPARKLAISASLAARLEAAGHGPVENVGQAFDPAPFFPVHEPRPSSDRPVVLVVGPCAADVKGIAVAYEGLTLWRKRGGDFFLRRVATEPPTEAERTGDLVDEYHRAVPPERMPFLYRACDVFIAPSRAEEGFGLPAVEALASGLPCLLSDTPGHREMAGESAWYFRDGDPAALAEALPGLLTPAARARAGAGAPLAAAQFEPARVAERLERAFAGALADGTPSR
jgi:glycosyltransferase involved in cell wall biosynthesis